MSRRRQRSLLNAALAIIFVAMLVLTSYILLSEPLNLFPDSLSFSPRPPLPPPPPPLPPPLSPPPPTLVVLAEKDPQFSKQQLSSTSQSHVVTRVVTHQYLKKKEGLAAPPSAPLPPLPLSKSAFLYLSELQTPLEFARASTLLRLFPSSFHLVITPSSYAARPLPSLPSSRVIDASGSGPVRVSRSRRWSHRCCSQEVAIGWAVAHASSFEHFWIMESDVHFEGDEAFRTFVEGVDDRYGHIDLVHQNDKMEDHPVGMDFIKAEKLRRGRSPWWYRVLYLDKFVTADARFEEPFYRGLYQLYRVSRKFVGALSDFYEKNDKSWVFFEPLVSTLAGQKRERGLQSRSFQALWRENKEAGERLRDTFKIGGHVTMRWRPCISEKDIKAAPDGVGIFHPVKGDFVSCTAQQQFMDVKEEFDEGRFQGDDREEKDAGGGEQSGE